MAIHFGAEVGHPKDIAVPTAGKSIANSQHDGLSKIAGRGPRFVAGRSEYTGYDDPYTLSWNHRAMAACCSDRRQQLNSISDSYISRWNLIVDVDQQ
jgi:hypothetical protein